MALSTELIGRWDGVVLPPARHAGVPRGVFLVAPEAFALATESATDNRYMQADQVFDPQRALAQFHGLQRALSEAGIPALSFAGRLHTPDAVFPNNVYATAPGRLVIGAMRHPVRQAEAARDDIERCCVDLLGYREVIRLDPAHMTAELTGSLVIDRARSIGYCGLSERCDRAGAHAMHAAFRLDGTLCFALASGEYHTNVVLSVLAGRALVLAADGLAEPAVAARLARLYPRTIALDASERRAYAGNCIALKTDEVWLSERAADGLRASSRLGFEQAGFKLRAVPLDELEKAGGSLRCMIGEFY